MAEKLHLIISKGRLFDVDHAELLVSYDFVSDFICDLKCTGIYTR